MAALLGRPVLLLAKGKETQVEQYLVLDIGGTFVKYAVMTRDGQFVLQGKVPADTASEQKDFFRRYSSCSASQE